MSDPFRSGSLANQAREQAELARHKEHTPAARAPSPRRCLPYLGVATLVASLVGGGLLVVAGGAAAGIYYAGLPRSQTVMATNSGTSVSVFFRVGVTDIDIERDPPGEPLQLLAIPQQDTQGRDIGVNSASVIVPRSAINDNGDVKFKLHYRALGFRREAQIQFKADKANVTFGKAILSAMPDKCVAFRTFNNQTLLYFTTLLAYKYSFSEVHWGIGEEPLDKNLRFKASDDPAQGLDENVDEMFVRIPDATSKIRLQIVYKDGTKSPVRTILRKDAAIP